MGQGIITKCRICKSRKLKYALKIAGNSFVICQLCTLLQRQEDIGAEIEVDLSTGMLSFDYYPYILLKKLSVDEDAVTLYSLKAVEVLLELRGYKVVQAQTTDEGKLEVQIEPLDTVERIRLFEMSKKLASQFTYFLFTLKNNDSKKNT